MTLTRRPTLRPVFMEQHPPAMAPVPVPSYSDDESLVERINYETERLQYELDLARNENEALRNDIVATTRTTQQAWWYTTDAPWQYKWY